MGLCILLFSRERYGCTMAFHHFWDQNQSILREVVIFNHHNSQTLFITVSGFCSVSYFGSVFYLQLWHHSHRENRFIECEFNYCENKALVHAKNHSKLLQYFEWKFRIIPVNCVSFTPILFIFSCFALFVTEKSSEWNHLHVWQNWDWNLQGRSPYSHKTWFWQTLSLLWTHHLMKKFERNKWKAPNSNTCMCSELQRLSLSIFFSSSLCDTTKQAQVLDLVK